MQIASKCKPARAVRAKTREKSGQYQKYNPSLHLKESYCIYPEWIITHEKCSGPFQYFRVFPRLMSTNLFPVGHKCCSLKLVFMREN